MYYTFFDCAKKIALYSYLNQKKKYKRKKKQMNEIDIN